MLPHALTTPGALLAVTALATVLGLAGCHRHGARQWVCHLGMGLATAAMLLPGHDPLGPLGWAAALVALAAWSWGSALRARAAGLVPDGPVPDGPVTAGLASGTLPASGPHRAWSGGQGAVPRGVLDGMRDVIELGAMAVLVVAMAAPAVGSGASSGAGGSTSTSGGTASMASMPGMPSMGSVAGHAHGASSGGGHVVVAALVVWAAFALVLHLRAGRAPQHDPSDPPRHGTRRLGRRVHRLGHGTRRPWPDARRTAAATASVLSVGVMAAMTFA